MNRIKRIIDVLMTLTFIPLMAYQVTGEAAHEWLGILMFALVITHQVLNRRWYTAILKGKYNTHRILNTIITSLLLVSFVLTAISGMAMSNHAVPFLYGLINVNTARIMHLAFSHWSFILMGLHIGMHVSTIISKVPNRIRKILVPIFTIIAGYGVYLFIRNGIINYITFRTHFAFLDYEKPVIIVFLENLLMLFSFIYIGAICKR